MNEAQWVSDQGFLCMRISIGVIFALPLILMLVTWIFRKASVSAALLGILSYLAGLVSYGIVWCLYVVVRTGGFVTTALPFSYYVVYAILAGLGAAFWNYFIRKLHYKKHRKPWDSLCFYSGFAFAVSVKTALPLVENLRAAMQYNHMGVKQLTAELGGSREGKLILERLNQVSIKDLTKGGTSFLISGLEFLLLMACFISIGVLLEQTMKKGKLLSVSFLLLVLFQIGTEIPALLAKGNRVAEESREVILAVIAVLAAICAWTVYYSNKKKEGKTGEKIGIENKEGNERKQRGENKERRWRVRHEDRGH